MAVYVPCGSVGLTEEGMRHVKLYRCADDLACGHCQAIIPASEGFTRRRFGPRLAPHCRDCSPFLDYGDSLNGGEA